MGFTPTQDQNRVLIEYDVSYRFTYKQPNPPESMSEEQERKYKPKPGQLICHIYDLSSKQDYIAQPGDDQSTAFAMALAMIPTTPKPLNRAQSKIAQNIAGGDPRDAEIAALKAQLASANKAGGTVSVTAPKRKGGRPRKNPSPNVPVETTVVA